jgi:integrase
MTNNHPSLTHANSELVGSQVRIFNRDGIFHANFQHDGKQQRKSLRTRNKKVARRRASLIDAQLIAGTYARGSRVATPATGVTKYEGSLRNEGRSKKTLQKYRLVFNRVMNLAETKGVTRLSGINLEFIDAYKAERVAGGAAMKTIHTEIIVIRQLINFALSRDMIVVDPLAKLKIKKPKPRRQPCWTQAQLDLILDASGDPYKSMMTALAETGMRVGELKHLTWADVDFDRKLIHIREKENWRPKTGDERSVPMSAKLRTVLAGQRRRCRWVFTAPPSPAYPRGDHQLSERRLLEYLKKVLGRLKLPGHVHTFRHTFISLALCTGVPEAVVRSWVGHVDPQVIRLYTHVYDDASRAEMDRLEEARQNPSCPKGKESPHVQMDQETD